MTLVNGIVGKLTVQTARAFLYELFGSGQGFPDNMTLAPGASVGVGGRGYGMMQGWNNTARLDVTAEMTVTPEQAIEYAQKYLDANFAGATVGHPTQFYGYYTLDFEKDGKVIGMLSVNGYSGQVFLHTWHGTFIEEAETSNLRTKAAVTLPCKNDCRLLFLLLTLRSFFVARHLCCLKTRDALRQGFDRLNLPAQARISRCRATSVNEVATDCTDSHGF